MDENGEILLRDDTDSGTGRVVTLTLNRPAQYNALSEDMLAALKAALDDIAGDVNDEGGVRCVVLAANGKAFCAGHDLKEMRGNPVSGHDKAYYRDLFEKCSEVMQGIVKLPVPVIARVQGMATAAGCQLVAGCDMAVAVDSAKFAVSGINVGLFCSTPAVALSRNIPRKSAFEMLVTGKFIDCATAKDLGLINDYVPADGLDDAVRELTDAICGKSAIAVRMGKELFYKQLEVGLSEAYDMAAEAMACNMMTEDVAEGIDAFTEKRPPNWKGR